MNTVKGIKVTLKQVLDSDSVNAANTEWITPKTATILSNNSGTLVESEDNSLYIVSVGNWFRSIFIAKSLPQVSQFNELQDKGLTAIKDKIIRNEEKKSEVKQVVKQHGQEIRGKDNVGIKKVDKAVAPNPQGEKKN